jgi:uncharacterized protein (DUF983 family)
LNGPPSTPPSPLRALGRGLRGRCPRCGVGRLFSGWNRLRDFCPACGLPFEPGSGDTWFFMYMTTAGLTGTLIVAMFLLRPRVVWMGQVAVLLAAFILIGLTLPLRKGLAVAIDYLVGRRARGL